MPTSSQFMGNGHDKSAAIDLTINAMGCRLLG
jgi:hypothetical protein